MPVAVNPVAAPQLAYALVRDGNAALNQPALIKTSQRQRFTMTIEESFDLDFVVAWNW